MTIFMSAEKMICINIAHNYIIYVDVSIFLPLTNCLHFSKEQIYLFIILGSDVCEVVL